MAIRSITQMSFSTRVLALLRDCDRPVTAGEVLEMMRELYPADRGDIIDVANVLMFLEDCGETQAQAEYWEAVDSRYQRYGR